ncbi:MAG: hypothetical protein RJA70_4103 [Pseudomonadota bacterium]
MLTTVNPAAPISRRSVEAEGFEALYAEHFLFVWRCLRGLGVANAQLDDAAQDVFVTLHRRLHTFEQVVSMRSWIFGIVRRVAYRYRRTAQRKPSAASEEGEAQAVEAGPQEHLQDAQAARFVDAFVQTLDHRKREVFVLGMLEGLSVPEIAEALEVPLNTAYTRLRRARAEFRTALSGRLESP